MASRYKTLNLGSVVEPIIELRGCAQPPQQRINVEDIFPTNIGVRNPGPKSATKASLRYYDR